MDKTLINNGVQKKIFFGNQIWILFVFVLILGACEHRIETVPVPPKKVPTKPIISPVPSTSPKASPEPSPSPSPSPGSSLDPDLSPLAWFLPSNPTYIAEENKEKISSTPDCEFDSFVPGGRIDCSELNKKCKIKVEEADPSYSAQSPAVYIYSCIPHDAREVFRGKVVDTFGSPIPQAVIKLRSPGTFLLSPPIPVSQTREDGSFLYKGTNAEALLAQKDGYESVHDKAHYMSGVQLSREIVGEFGFKKWVHSDLIIKLRKMPRSDRPASVSPPSFGEKCIVSGRVLNSQGVPVKEAQVSIQQGVGLPPITTISDEHGYYLIEKAMPCPDLCTINKPGYKAVQGPFQQGKEPKLEYNKYVSCLEGQPGDVFLMQSSH